jgi:hypothetical protein
VKCGQSFVDPERVPLAGPCENGNEPSCFTEGEEFLDQPSDYHLIENDSASCVRYLIDRFS